MALFTINIKLNEFLLGEGLRQKQIEKRDSNDLAEVFVSGNDNTITNLLSNSESIDRLRELLLYYNIKIKHVCVLHFQRKMELQEKEIEVLVYTIEQDKEE